MKKLKFFFSPGRALWTAGAGMCLITLLLQLAARKISGFGQWYSTHIYRLIEEIVARITGIFPFSLSELCLYLLIVLILISLIRHIRKPVKLLARAFCLISALALIFTLNCGINYYRRPFSAGSGLEIRPSSVQELYQLCSYLALQIQRTAQELSQTQGYEGQPSPQDTLSVSQLAQMGLQGRTAMEHLGEEYPELSGFYPIPKPVMVSWILSVQQLCGIYSPFTVEANYNRQMPWYNIPHTICHELSHLKGFMWEDEANFIGYLACIQSQDLFFAYSGYLMGWVYAGNALASADRQLYLELREKLPPQAAADLACNNAYWDSFDGAVAQASARVNDTYLKIQDQSEGVKSYGRMVDLMLAYYRTSSSSQQSAAVSGF